MNHCELLLQTELYKDGMSQGERLRAYWSGREVDRLPVSISVRETMAPLYGLTIGGYRRNFECRAMVYEKACRDFACLGVSIGPNLKKIGEALGAHAVYPENSVDDLTSQPLRDITLLKDLEPPDPYIAPVLREMLDEMGSYRRRFGGDCPLSTDIAGPLSTAASIMPLRILLKELLKRPDDIQKLLEFSLEAVLHWVMAANREYGVTAVNVADPVASCSVIGPNLFRAVAAPYLLRLRQEVERITGKKPGLHICGSTAPVWQEIAELGYAGFRVDNSEDLAALKLAVGKKMAISGNVPPVEVMLYGSIDQVLKSARECISLGSDNPCGYTLAAGCQLPPGVSADNMLALLLAARKYGRNARIGQAVDSVDGGNHMENHKRE